MENIFNIVEHVFGEDIEVSNLNSFDNSLPLIYKQNFKIYLVKGTFEFILVVPKDEFLERDLVIGAARYIKKIANKIVFAYLNDCSQKNKLFFKEEKINFISSDSDHFLASNNNSENIYDSDDFIDKNRYTKKTQLVAQFYLTHEVKPYTVREIANFLGFSPSSVSRANSFFLEHRAINKIGLSSSADYIIESKEKFFNAIKPFIINPARRKITTLIRSNENRLKTFNLFKCGESALEEFTNLEKTNRAFQYAVNNIDFKKIEISYKDWLVDSLDINLYTIYEFIYDPSIFAKNGTISPFDLFAMIYNFYKNSNNSRVKESMELLEGMITNE